MCGHVGVAGNLEYKDEKLMKRLLIYDVFRGQDGTGLAALRKNGEVVIAKMASHPIDLFDTSKFNIALTASSSTVFLGHNRYKTQGSINAVNTHPFEFGTITGAHNGTLTKASWTAIEEALGEQFDVDSAAVIASIAKFGIEKTASMMDGAWALVWIDTSDNSLNFLRNKERPLWHSFSDKCDKIIWASEYPIIDCAVKSDGVHELFVQPGKDPKTGIDVFYRFFAFDVDLWYKFDLANLKEGSDTRPKPKVKVCKGKEPAPVVYHTSGTHPFIPKTKTPNGTTTSLGSKSGQKKNDKLVTVLEGTVDAPFAGIIDRDDFDFMAKAGCTWCSSDVEYEEPGLTLYFNQQIILCPTCGNNESTNTRVFLPRDA